ncbi:hypothetical protein N5V62_20250, partial [Escherichia coli]|nr:hypothetical protein [Escherichia coli]
HRALSEHKTLSISWSHYQRLITNVRSVKVGYQALLWSFRLWQWRDKTRSHHRITRSAFNLR